MTWITDYIHIWGTLLFLMLAIAFNEYRTMRKRKMQYYRDLKTYCRERMLPIPCDPEIETLYKQGFMREEK